MPINVSAFVGHGDSCTCYRCRVRREVQGFQRFLDSLSEKFGGLTPRNYNYRLNFNQPVERGSRPVEPSGMSLEQVEQIKFNVNNCLQYNVKVMEGVSETMLPKWGFCWDCGKFHRFNSLYVLTDEQGVTHYICGDCVRSGYRVCNQCEELHRRHEFHSVDGTYFCNSCFNRKYYRCHHCDHTFKLGDEHRFEFSHPDNSITPYVLCPTCKAHLHQCTACGHHFFELRDRVNQRRGLCRQCFEDRSTIRQYSHKPMPRFKTADKLEKIRSDKLMTGFENELENEGGTINEDIAAALTDAMGEGFLYCKRDGSLNNGFEIVTHPFSWAWYVQNRNKLEVMTRRAYEMGMRAMPSCGLHIHMSKAAFTHGQIYKFWKFMYDRKNRPFVVLVSRRGGENHYSSFNSEDLDKAALVGKTKMNASHDRHSAVNGTGQHTVEVRVFRGTHQPIELFAAIEFVYALYEFVCNNGYRDMEYWNLLNWLCKRHVANQYRNLVLWLRDHLGPNDKEKFRRRLKKNKVSLNLKKGE